MILVMTLFALFASTFVFGEAALLFIKPFFLVALRFLFASIVLLVYQWFANRPSLHIKKQDYGLILLTAFMLMFIAYAIEFWVLQYMSGAKVSLIWNLSPFITAIFSYFLLNEIMTVKKLVGLIIGFLGFIPLLVAPSAREQSMNTFFSLSWPELLLIFGVFCSAYGWIVFRRTMDRGYQPLVINGYSMFFAFIFSLIMAFIFEGPWNPMPVFNWPKALGYIFALTLIGNVICFNLYGYLLKRYSTTYLSFCGFMTPVFAAIIQYFYLGNPIGIPFVVTLLIVSVGLYIFYQEELRQGYIK